MSTSSLPRYLYFKTSLKLALCLSLAAGADFLFYGKSAGWTLGLYALLVLLTGLACNYFRIGANFPAISASVAAMTLAASLMDDPKSLTCFMEVITVFAFAAGLRHPFINDIRQFAGSICGGVLLAGWHAFRDAMLLAYIQKRRKKSRQGSFLRHWLMPTVLSVLFIVLFAMANPVLSSWLAAVNWQVILDYLSPLRIFFWLSVLAGCWSVIRPRFRAPGQHSAIRLPRQGFTVTGLLFNERSIPIALILFNILFAGQNGMDIAVLGGAAALPQGMTYAQYAHQGAYPLLFTAVLAAVLVLIVMRPGSAGGRDPLIRALVYGWVGQNMFLLFSSAIRLAGYIGEFSLTYLRVAAFIWMGLVAIGLALILARIHFNKSNLWLINANGGVLYAALYVCCFIHFGSIIAEYNVRHCNDAVAGGPALDVGYLHAIGPEALPSLLWYREHYPHDNNGAIGEPILNLNISLGRSLQDWRQWTFTNWRIHAELQSLYCASAASCPW